jgi:hypothetical protein
MAATRRGVLDSEQVEKDRCDWEEKVPRYARLLDRVERFVFVSRLWPKGGFMFDVIVFGGGPVGLSAAMTLGRALRKTLVLESSPWS